MTHAHLLSQLLASEANLPLLSIYRGIEKEGLRINADNDRIADTPHPTLLGSALTHTSITTDYSEALLEFITPVSDSVGATLTTLSDLHAFTSQALDREYIWCGSMPCEIDDESTIPIADYGNSNIGTMKRVYRNGLSARYGRAMQVIAGIHYNFSLCDEFFAQGWALSDQSTTLQQFRTDCYLGLIRNFSSRSWLLSYLTGASPAFAKSFLQNRDHKPMPAMGNDTLFQQHATSLRMGDLGYTSQAQADLLICYNQIDTYIDTLRDAISTVYHEYQAIPDHHDGEKQQLNTGLLQIENEFYSAIRPKRVTRSGEAPVAALKDRGIEYIEVRSIDLNPFTPLGIDASTIHLLDTFLLACLISDSPMCTEQSRAIDAENSARVLLQGRDPNLMLLDHGNNELRLEQLAMPIFEELDAAAELLDRANGTTDHQVAVAEAKRLVANPELTPSARLLAEMESEALSHSEVISRYSKQWDGLHRRTEMTPETRIALADEAVSSLRRQRDIEESDSESFDSYLERFYAQYETV